MNGTYMIPDCSEGNRRCSGLSVISIWADLCSSSLAGEELASEELETESLNVCASRYSPINASKSTGFLSSCTFLNENSLYFKVRISSSASCESFETTIEQAVDCELLRYVGPTGESAVFFAKSTSRLICRFCTRRLLCINSLK